VRETRTHGSSLARGGGDERAASPDGAASGASVDDLGAQGPSPDRGATRACSRAMSAKRDPARRARDAERLKRAWRRAAWSLGLPADLAELSPGPGERLRVLHAMAFRFSGCTSREARARPVATAVTPGPPAPACPLRLRPPGWSQRQITSRPAAPSLPPATGCSRGCDSRDRSPARTNGATHPPPEPGSEGGGLASWAVGVRASSRSSVLSSTRAPRWDSRRASSPAVSSTPMGVPS
jgi:hypothetical protein